MTDGSRSSQESVRGAAPQPGWRLCQPLSPPPTSHSMSVQLGLTHSLSFLLLCAGLSSGQTPTHEVLLLLLFTLHSNLGRLIRDITCRWGTETASDDGDLP